MMTNQSGSDTELEDSDKENQIWRSGVETIEEVVRAEKSRKEFSYKEPCLLEIDATEKLLPTAFDMEGGLLDIPRKKIWM